jgi:hypothetical protein
MEPIETEIITAHMSTKAMLTKVNTTRLVIPIQGWELTPNDVIVFLQGMRIRIPFPNDFTNATAKLTLELFHMETTPCQPSTTIPPTTTSKCSSSETPTLEKPAA